MKKLGYLVVALTAISAIGCSGESAPEDVTAIQKEAKSQVPEGLGTVPKDQAEEGLNMMGGGKKGTGGQ